MLPLLLKLNGIASCATQDNYLAEQLSTSTTITRCLTAETDSNKERKVVVDQAAIIKVDLEKAAAIMKVVLEEEVEWVEWAE